MWLLFHDEWRVGFGRRSTACGVAVERSHRSQHSTAVTDNSFSFSISSTSELLWLIDLLLCFSLMS